MSLHKQKKGLQKKYFFCRYILMRVLVMALAVSVINIAKAQTYYYFVYEAAKGTELITYKALVTLHQDGRATSRVQYNAGENKQLFLYEQELIDSTETSGDNAIKYLMPQREAVPQLSPDTNGFLQPRFRFEKKYDSTGYYHAAAGVEVIATGKDWVAAKMTTSEQKTYEELRRDEAFTGSFYFESEAFYQYIFDQQTREVPLVRTEQLFLFVVANTNDATVGASAKTDLQNVSRLFTKLAQDLGIAKVFPLYISGEAYSKRAVEAALAVLESKKPSAKDIVIFYFSGHGFRLPGDISIYPRMSFRTAQNKAKQEVGDNLGLEDVYKRILALKPGVTLVLGDCCNADIFENPVFGQDMIRPKGGGVLGNFNPENGNKLFFPPAPVAMIIGSVNKGHLSVGHPEIGGYFTHFFTSELEKNLWGYYSNSRLPLSGKSNASWLRMLVTARQNTFQKSRAKQCGKTENDRCIQQAEISVNPPQ